ncbi:MAG: hypothetical protein HFG71_04885 [Hungatella sp.]|jgi:hypothetical protein|nr:hypothetical protein [Hungatella sp.]
MFEKSVWNSGWGPGAAAPIPDLSPENVFPPRYQVNARIAARFQWRLLEEYGPDSFAPQKDGTLLFSFEFTNKEEIIW